MKTPLARREFLRIMAQGFGAYAVHSTLLDGLAGQILNAAYADAMGLQAAANPNQMFYVHLTTSLAPPRWYFDQPLTPKGKTAANFKPGNFGTTIVQKGGLTAVEYATVPITAGGKTYHLPPVWGMNLSQHRFSDLFQNMIMFRGVDMEINNHNLSNKRQVSPVIGGYSISGILADANNSPIPSLLDPRAPAATAFRSKNGFSGTTLSYTENNTTNPVRSVLAPFVEYRTGRGFHSKRSMALVDQAFSQFDIYAKNNGLTDSALNKMYESAAAMVDDKVVALASNWANTVAKYRAIVAEAIHPRKGTLPGLYDAAIPGNQASNPTLITDLNRFAKLTDLRDLIQGETSLPFMAENFAAAEILLGAQLTTTASLNFPALSNVHDGNGVLSISHDQHNTGSAVSVLVSTLFFRALLGCLSAFKKALVQKGLFNRTVIHLSSEFSRTPRVTGAGSDHGYMSGSTSIISGMIQKPAVIGNIQINDYNATYAGTFGVAANMAIPGSSEPARPLRVNDISRTITSMLGVDDVTTNGSPLLKPSGALWIPKKEEANNV